jgi:hypothetical protein
MMRQGNGGASMQRKLGILVIFTVFMVLPVVLCIAEEGAEKEGLFSKGSFLSDTINSITNKFSSGSEKIVDRDAKGVPQDMLEYDGDPLGRPLPKPTSPGNKRRQDE